MKTLKTIVVIAALILSAGAGFFVNYYLMNKNEDLNLKTEEEAKKNFPILIWMEFTWTRRILTMK